MISLWNVLSDLPVEVYGSAVLSMLDLKSCVQLHSAADKVGVKSLAAAMSHYSAAKPIAVQTDMPSALHWLHEKRVRSLQFHVTRDCGKLFATVIQFLPLINSIVLTLNNNEQLVIAQLSRDLQIASKIVSLNIFGKVDPQVLADVPNQMQNLRTIHMLHSPEADSWYTQLLNNNPEIHSIDLIYVTQMSSSLVAAFWNLPKLLDLAVDCFGDGCSATVAALATGHYPHLIKLTLSSKGWVQLGIELVDLVQCCPQLEELRVAGFTAEGATVLGLIQICGNLRVLRWNRMILTNTVLDALVTANPPLRDLDLCWAVRDMDAVHRAASLLGSLHAFSTNHDTYADCDATLAAAVRLMTGLQSLSITGFSLQSQVLEAAAQGSTCLTSLYTHCGCRGFDLNVWLGAMARRNPQLLRVNVALYGGYTQGDLGLGDTGLYVLAAHCPGLEELSCLCNSSVSDTAVVAVAEHCPHLKRLFLPYINDKTRLTDACVLALAKGCPELEVLNIICTNLVTEGALLQLINCCPRLCQLNVSAASVSEQAAVQLMQQRAGGRRLEVSRGY